METEVDERDGPERCERNGEEASVTMCTLKNIDRESLAKLPNTKENPCNKPNLNVCPV